MKIYTATHTQGQARIAVHATGCVHAVDPNRVVGYGDTIQEALDQAMNICDPDNDWPGHFKPQVVACAKKVSA